MRTSYNEDGVGVTRVYYDNIINLSIYRGANKVFGSDFHKQMFSQNIPSEFIEQAVLGNLQYDKTDESGFHFMATVCIPDEASCYMVGTNVSLDGSLTMTLLEY